MKRRRDSTSEQLETAKKVRMSIDADQNPLSASHASIEPAIEYNVSAAQAPRAPSQTPSGSPIVTNPAQPLSSKKKRPPRSKRPSMLKRSTSTPQLSAAEFGDDDPESPGSAETRRNKLGYHRTSVACGHCRRRKIRCLVDLSDGQGRCTNCIRLKKECNFYPVEQVSTSEKHGKPSKSESASGRVSATSSQTPPSHSAQLGLPNEQLNQYGQIPITSPYEFAIPTRAGLGIMTPRDEQVSNVYPPGFGTPESWDAASFPHQPSIRAPADQRSGSLPNEHWRLSDQASASTYNLYEHQPPNFNQNMAGQMQLPYGEHSNDIGWLGPAQRSMSLSHIDNIPRNYSPLPPHPQNARQRMMVNYPPSINTGVATSNSPMPDTRVLPLSAPIGSHMTPHVPFQQPWNPYNVPQPYPNAENKPHNTFVAGNTWYQEPAPLEQVNEELEDRGIVLESQRGQPFLPGQSFSEYPQNSFSGPFKPG